jgi:20S proteasome subunit beta 3
LPFILILLLVLANKIIMTPVLQSKCFLRFYKKLRGVPVLFGYSYGCVLLLLLLLRTPRSRAENAMTMNGGSALAMAGKNCVAVAVDKRFGSGPALVQVVARPPLTVASPMTLVAWTGLQSDVESMHHDLATKVARTLNRGLGFRANSNINSPGVRTISPRALSSLTSHVLYGRKRAPYLVEPIVVGLETYQEEDDDVVASTTTPSQRATTTKKQRNHHRELLYRPFLSCLDCIGASSESDSFVCAGAATQSLYGTAEALWKKDLPPDELWRLCGQAFLSALERDCLSGYGALVYLITPDGIVEYDLETRND